MGTLSICVTVDWEGMNLQQANLIAMSKFRKEFPEIPLTHFICPAYFTSKIADAGNLIRKQIQANDELALHIHCWKSLVEAAGLIFHNTPCWYKNPPDYSGHGVPLGSYSLEDIRKLIKYSTECLKREIKDVAIHGFRCGGWMCNDRVFEALYKEGFRYDSSMTDSNWFANIEEELKRSGVELGTWVKELWGSVQMNVPEFKTNSVSLNSQPLPKGGINTTQPFIINIGPATLIECPDNGILIDYLTEQNMLDRLNNAKRIAEHSDYIFICGFHQESATWPGWNNSTNFNLEIFSEALRKFRSGNVDTKIEFKLLRDIKLTHSKKPHNHEMPLVNHDLNRFWG